MGAIWLFSHLHPALRYAPELRPRFLLLQMLSAPTASRPLVFLQSNQRRSDPNNSSVKLKPHRLNSPNTSLSDTVTEAKSKPETNKDTLEKSQEHKPEVDRDVRRISQLLERDLRFEEQKLQAAKPPNQIVREYWEKQNHPYKDKWDELAHKIEKAGKPRDLQIETFKSWDGTQISKIDGRCYKAPDPGRTYLHQEEVRQVICPR